MENLSSDDTHIWCPVGIGNKEISEVPIGRTYLESFRLKRPITAEDKLKIDIGIFNGFQLMDTSCGELQSACRIDFEKFLSKHKALAEDQVDYERSTQFGLEFKPVDLNVRRKFQTEIFETASDLCKLTYDQYYEEIQSFIRQDEDKYCEKYAGKACQIFCKAICRKNLGDCSKTQINDDFALKCSSKKKLTFDEFCDLKPVEFTRKNFCSLGADGNLQWSGQKNKNEICDELDVEICEKFEPCRVHTFDDGEDVCESIAPNVFIKGLSFAPARGAKDDQDEQDNPWTAYFMNLFG